ncbi:MAG: hypothetical protein KDD44_04845 [Bdellovibrionales bacterium]|nr:hypothetical protein [Bdellovibrionales bacterium]
MLHSMQSLPWTTILICAAVEEELRSLRSLPPQFRMVTTGVGPVEAACSVAELASSLEHPESTAVIFIGSCGSYDEAVPLLTPVACRDVCLRSDVLESASTYTPAVVPRVVNADPHLLQFLLSRQPESFRSVSMCSAFSISTNCSERGEHERGMFENLELFGVARACARRGIPWGSVSIVTNHCTPNAHSQWNELRAVASERTAELVQAIFCSR